MVQRRRGVLQTKHDLLTANLVQAGKVPLFRARPRQ